MEPPKTDGVGGVGCPPCMKDGDGSVSLPLSLPCKKETVAAWGGPKELSVSGPWEGRRGYAGVSAARLSVSPSLVGLWDERSVLSVASSSSSHRS